MFATDYEIEKSSKKLYLVALDPGRKRLGAAEKLYVTVNAKNGCLSINKTVADALDMHKSWIKLSYDSTNSVIAWRIRHELDNDQLREQGWKYVEGNKTNGIIALGVKRILDTFQHVEDKVYKKQEVKKYQDKTSALDSDTYYFIELSSV